MISKPMGQIWLWTSIAGMLLEEDADYFRNFWTQPGYIGHDEPQWVAKDVIDVHLPITRLVTAQDLLGADFAGPEFAEAKPMALMQASSTGQWDLPVGIEVKGLSGGYRTGAGIRLETGDSAGRQLYCMRNVGDFFFCDGRAEANLLRFRGAKAGDMVHIENRAFLAFCYMYRYHISDSALNDFLRVDGRAVFPQHGVPLASPLMGVPYSGQFEGKLLWIHHTHDASLWPPQGVIYQQAVEQAQGPDKAREKFRLQWTENAEHVPPVWLPSHPNRATTTWLIDYMPSIEQGLVDLAAWVEQGIAPPETQFTFADGKVTLPDGAAARGGTQPFVQVHANGAARAHVRVGEEVVVSVHAEAPPGAGSFTQLHWATRPDGAFDRGGEVPPGQTVLDETIRCSFAAPGTYFVTARARLNREGNPQARRQVENLASARIVVEAA